MMDGYFLFFLLCLGFTLASGRLTWILAQKLKQAQSSEKHALIGIALALVGLFTLACGACGLMVLTS